MRTKGTSSRRAACVFAVAACMSGAAISAGQAQAAPMGAEQLVVTTPVVRDISQTFPIIQRNVHPVPFYDAQGKPESSNSIVWEYGTVLTRSQTMLVRDSGALPMVGQTGVRPYASLSRNAQKILDSNRAKFATGRYCLSLYWNDRPFLFEGKMVQVQVQGLSPKNCRP